MDPKIGETVYDPAADGRISGAVVRAHDGKNNEKITSPDQWRL